MISKKNEPKEADEVDGDDGVFGEVVDTDKTLKSKPKKLKPKPKSNA